MIDPYPVMAEMSAITANTVPSAETANENTFYEISSNQSYIKSTRGSVYKLTLALCCKLYIFIECISIWYKERLTLSLELVYVFLWSVRA